MKLQLAPSSRRAFTLIESMMAVVILAFAVSALSTVLYATARNAQTSEGMNIAVEVARNDMETILAGRLSDISSANGASTEEAISSSSLSATDQPVTHTGAVQYITRSAGQGSRDLAIVKMVTTTSDGQTITFQRLVTRAGASQ